MRKIKINEWDAKNPSGEMIKEDIIVLLTVMINGKKPEDIPKGLDKFRLFNRLSKAFDKAKETKELILEEADYKFLKNMLDEGIPSIWGSNSSIFQAVEDFVNAKEE